MKKNRSLNYFHSGGSRQILLKIQLLFVILSVSFAAMASDWNTPLTKPGQTKSPAEQQLKKISGTVTDTGGVPIPGATILAVGTTAGTTTDIDGIFTLKIPDEA